MVTVAKQIDKLPRASRRAVGSYFFVNGALIATWATRLPAIKDKLALHPSEVGVALLGSAVGALFAMNLCGYLSARFGSKIVVIVMALCACASIPFIALAPNLPLLFASLVFFGAGNGGMDVSMNTQAVDVERLYHRPILTSFHAWFSIGGLTGALLGGLVASRDIAPLPHFLGATIIGALIIIGTSRFLLPTESDPDAGKIRFSLPSGILIALGLVSFCSVVGEGSMADWSAIYMAGTLGSGAGVAAIGYAVFSLAMAGSRSVGDLFTARFGPKALVRFGGLVAACGLSLALVSASFPLSFSVPITLLGFGFVGIGFSIIFPITISAAGRTPGQASSTAIAAVSTCGYLGFLAGPPVIGFVADLVTLRIALGVVVILSLIVASLAKFVDIAKPEKEGHVSREV